jgi:hypothetical protein
MGGSGDGVEGGRDGGPRRNVLHGRYDKLREGRLSGNRWELLENDSEGVERRREGLTERREVSDNGDERTRNVEMVELEDDTTVTRNDQGRDSSGVESRRKRNLEERSPGMHEGQRVNRRRVNEFEMGKMFEEIVKKMERDIDSLIDRAPDAFKRELKEGLGIMMDGMQSMMSGVSDGMASERLAREAEEIRTEDKMEKIMDEVKEIKNVSSGMVNDRMEQRVKASEKEMEEKVKAASCSLKLLDIDFGEATEDRVRMVRKVITGLKDDVFPDDRRVYDRVMRRTRVVILGKRTTASNSRGRTVYTVPVLLECQNKTDASELDAVLRKAGYFSAFHWPQEMVEFVEKAREEVRKMGYRDNTHYIRVRPEERGGSVQIRADVKEKNGGRFQAKAVWQCPPLNKDLWEFLNGLFVPKVIGGRQERR